MVLLGSIVLFIYIVTLLYLLIGYQKIKPFQSKKIGASIRFSIIIPFRDEAVHLPNLLNSIAKINYPSSLFELIFVDDSSTDDSVEIIKNENRFNNYRIIKNKRVSKSPKKDALTEAIKLAKYEWIITTDADCISTENWLQNFNNYITTYKSNMIVGPVRYQNEKGLVNAYQLLDNSSLQTVTIGAFGIRRPIMCNGANLAYRKDLFYELSGFSGNDDLASGDDVFLMDKFIKKDKTKVQFIKNKDAIITTKTEKTWKNIIDQRIRWASKTSKQKNINSQLIGLIVLFTNIYLLIGVFYALINFSFLKIYLGFLFIKLFTDFIFNSRSISFLNYKISMKHYLLSLLLYPIIVFIVFLKSLDGSFNWKERSYKNGL